MDDLEYMANLDYTQFYFHLHNHQNLLLIFSNFIYFRISLSHLSFACFKNISHFYFSFTYILLSHSLNFDFALHTLIFPLSIINFSFASHTFNISLSHTLSALAPYRYIAILSNVCSLLSSFLLNPILLTC